MAMEKDVKERQLQHDETGLVPTLTSVDGKNVSRNSGEMVQSAESLPHKPES